MTLFVNSLKHFREKNATNHIDPLKEERLLTTLPYDANRNTNNQV